jgi:D-beta-D-heptose 7-phosphate kinase/D-beta-D-heptose 1-phosphate adenosyltransferase
LHLKNNTEVLQQLANARSTGKKIVFTNGCFDILHVGHLRYLSQARELGDCLVVGLNSDSSISRLKGPLRPIVGEEERKEMLLGLKPVDFVCLFEDDTPLSLIKEVRPHVLTKGGDWAKEDIVGGSEVESWGGEVLSLPFVEGSSTTCIIEKVLASQ